MITIDLFLIALMAISTLTGLVTEAVKKILAECKVDYRANTVAGIVAAVLSIGVGVCYVIFNGMAFTAQIVVCIIALVFMSWLSAMVGYDKVIELFKKTK